MEQYELVLKYFVQERQGRLNSIAALQHLIDTLPQNTDAYHWCVGRKDELEMELLAVNIKVEEAILAVKT